MFATLGLLLTIGTAQASGTDTQSFDLTTDVEAWPTTEIDSGWWPESGPVRIRTLLFAEGVASIEMPGTSIVEQGSAGTVHRVEPSGEESYAGIDLSIAASLFLSLDVAGYTWEDVLHEQEVDFDVSQTFSDFAFAQDGGSELVLPMDSVDIFEIDQGIFPLVNVVVSGALRPTAAVAINTDSIETDWGEFTASGQKVSTGGGATTIDALGTLDSELSMTLKGHAEVCITFVNCYGDFNYDFDMDPVEYSQDLTYDAVSINHAQMGPSAANGGAGAAQSGGCSTVPGNTLESMGLAVMLMALVARRRKQ